MSNQPDADSPSQLIDETISEMTDWRGQTLGRLRELIHEADPDLVEIYCYPVPTFS